VVPVIGLTGGIASGKSTAQEAFAHRGAHVFDADQVARDLVEPGQPCLSSIVETFGSDLLNAMGRLDRGRLRERVFADASARRALEAILHPSIRSELLRRAAGVTEGYVMLAIPLLVESGRYEWIDRVLLIDVSPDVQVARVMTRDGQTRSQALAALAAQTSRARRLAVAQDVIINDATPTILEAAVARLHTRYLMLRAA